MHVCEGEKERKNENIWGGFKRIQKCLQRQERRLGMKISRCLQEKGKWTNEEKISVHYILNHFAPPKEKTI